MAHPGAHLPVEQNVLWLEVAVVHMVLVAMVQRGDDVHEIAPRLVFWQPAAFGNPVEKLAALPDTREPLSKLFVALRLRRGEGNPLPRPPVGAPKGPLAHAPSLRAWHNSMIM